MIRPIIIVVNLLIAFWIKLLATDPSAEVMAPSSVKAGESFIVNVNVKPNGETGFLRFAMELQPGWKAEKVEAAGASFYFEKNSANDNYSAKFLWSRVGEVSEMKISFRVIPPSNAGGDYEFPCKISHTVDNLPANIQLNPLKININNPAAQSANNNSNQPDSTSKPAALISVLRTVPSEPIPGEFLIDVVINKEDLVNFGKFQDSLPAGFTAKKVMSDGGTFSFENGMVKFYWPVLPKKSSLHIQYKITASPEVNGTQLINGYFSYVENENGKIYRIPVTTINVAGTSAIVEQDTSSQQNNASAQNNQQDNSQNSQANKQVNTQDNSQNAQANNQQDNSQNSQANKQVNTQDNSQNAQANNQQDNSLNSQANKQVNTQDNSQNAQANNQQDNSQNNQANKQVNTQDNNQQSSGNSQQSAQSSSSSSAGVTYRVQIAAMSRMVPVEYYYTSFNISGTINMEQVDGLNKYTHGSFTAYQEARNHRESLRSKGVSDAFVTAYSNGKRVTVQEALMITSQKWIR